MLRRSSSFSQLSFDGHIVSTSVENIRIGASIFSTGMIESGLIFLSVLISRIWEPLKTGLKRENGQSAPNAMKADEVRLYALRGGFLKQSLCYTHFHSNKVFRGDLYSFRTFHVYNPPFCERRQCARLSFYQTFFIRLTDSGL